MDDEALAIVAELLLNTRQASLATHDGDGPYAAMVAFAAEPGLAGLLLHLSDLALHKDHLRADDRAALMVSRPDDGRTEPLQHPRVTLRCQARIVAKGTPAYDAARAVYLAKYPRHHVTFGLGDFDLFRLTPVEGLLNAGFGRAYALRPDDLGAAAALSRRAPAGGGPVGGGPAGGESEASGPADGGLAGGAQTDGGLATGGSAGDSS